MRKMDNLLGIRFVIHHIRRKYVVLRPQCYPSLGFLSICFHLLVETAPGDLPILRGTNALAVHRRSAFRRRLSLVPSLNGAYGSQRTLYDARQFQARLQVLGGNSSAATGTGIYQQEDHGRAMGRPEQVRGLIT